MNLDYVLGFKDMVIKEHIRDHQPDLLVENASTIQYSAKELKA